MRYDSAMIEKFAEECRMVGPKLERNQVSTPVQGEPLPIEVVCSLCVPVMARTVFAFEWTSKLEDIEDILHDSIVALIATPLRRWPDEIWEDTVRRLRALSSHIAMRETRNFTRRRDLERRCAASCEQLFFTESAGGMSRRRFDDEEASLREYTEDMCESPEVQFEHREILALIELGLQ